MLNIGKHLIDKLKELCREILLYNFIIMEAVQNKTVHNTKSNSAVSCINETNTDGLSKEKDELLFGAEEDGEDEDALSDDSLRLRLSDDEDAEQEVVTKNHTNISEFKSPNKDPEISPKDIITEENSSSDPQQVVEEAVTSGGEKPTPKEPNSAINDPENSALPSDECTSENKLTQNNVHNLENSTVVIANGETNEKYTLNINDKKISQDTNNMKNEMQLNHIDDENIVKSEVSDNNSQRENSVIKCIFNSDKNKDLNIIEVDNACKKEISEENIQENDNLSIDNPTETDSRNVELMNDNEVKLKEAVNECDKIDSATCNSNNLNTSDNKDNKDDKNNKDNKDDKDDKDNKDHLVNSVKLKIGSDEELSKTTTISDKCDDNLTILSDNVVEKVIVLKHQFTEIDNDHDSIDTIKSYSSDDNSASFKYSKKRKSKMDSLEHDDITQDINIRKMQSVQREMNSELTENKNNSSDIIDLNEIEITNKDHDVNKPISKITDNATSTNLPALVSIIVKDDDSETDDTDTIVERRKRLKNKRLDISAAQVCIIEEDKQEVTNVGRQRRRTAKNAEEIIRKKYLISDSDISDSDSDSEELSVNYKLNQHLYSTSSTSLKRNCPVSDEDVVVNGTVKKVKMGNKSEQTNVKNDFTKLSFVEKFCQRSIKEKIPKLTQEQLEELLIQKIVETITMRSEIGLLREQARISERSQEATRTKLQQLMKQVKDFEMVLNRNAVDRRTNPDKIVTPIKINRSVGLQVNFVTEHGIQNLRQIQQTQQKTPNAPSSVSNPVPEPTSKTNSSPRRGIKIRSPRRPETSVASSIPAVSQSSMQTSPLISTVTPAALVVAKPLDSQQTLTLPNQSSSTIQQLLTGNISQQQTYVLNGKVQNQTNRPNTLIASKPKNNDLIDLTDEEEKNKSTKITATPVPALVEQQLPTTITTKPVQCFPRVIQTIPTNVSITSQPTNIRVVQPNQPTPTAVVNNGAPSRVTYVMQGSVGATRQLLITSNASQIRPITTCRVTTPFPAVTYKTGTSTIANGTVRVLTTPAVSNIPINIACKHPAPLPDTPSYAINTNWKLPPPAPSLKMSKVPNGIVLSWNMQLTDKYADIASYQLYAYQEVAGVTPSTSLWKKVGDVRALPLPMACTLTQFSEGNNYYFAVRAVDTHSRKGQYSIPGNISL
ncbi:activating transcription factor 7-interacting protein 1 isoform X2 [Odontomachus brunneus]|uniref:activating transcription factor 7-interacting protein 1 isoform X2 n=1 Tax=Odontomachus brunneus TaxID=486640 RepID=UPI0013F1B478|nr:activating transcription factor 7-interacting protein 1 isoform X2 [Odontomachus brunneus]